jgi:hypothetical protein
MTNDSNDSLAPVVLGGWALACVVLLVASITAIAGLRFPDPDDAMRLMEVRDWLAGQGWFDVAQHRLNHGNFPMHWSRLVDLPIAAVLAPLTSLLGPTAAVRVAMTVVPLLTLLAVMAMAAAITRRVAGAAVARVAVLLVPLSVPIIFQVRPMRIDHHGWQIVLALVATHALLGRATPRRGALAGVALATLLTISLEGMPIAAAIAGVAALAWAFQPARRAFLLALAGTLAGAAIVLHVVTRGPGMMQPACDAIAPAWLAMLTVAALGIGAAVLVERFGLVARLVALAAAGVSTGAVLLLAAPQCAAGPFATLPPLVYRLWYLSVTEGLPLWAQTPDWAVITIGLPLAGLAGGAMAWRASEGAARDRWTILLALLAVATGVAVMVNRAGGTANALAVPGAAWLLLGMLTRARTVVSPARRTLATAGALMLASPGQVAALVALLLIPLYRSEAKLSAERDWHRAPCERIDEIRALGQLPPGTVFAPIDVSPDLIATTAHRAIAGGYHRGAAAMDVVARGFLAAPDRARAIVMASGADYVAVCPGLNEVELYRTNSPDGLWGRLERGERIAWLRPLPLADTHVLAWRVVRPASSGALP